MTSRLPPAVTSPRCWRSGGSWRRWGRWGRGGVGEGPRPPRGKTAASGGGAARPRPPLGALQDRKRRRIRREAARRFFRASPPEPQNPYGNLPGPFPPAAPPRPPQDEEGEGHEGYEEPDTGSYENAPAAMGGGAGGPYEAMAAAGEGLREPPWRGRGGDDDSASYENMEAPLG
ncbi:5'-3' exoribonuclease 2-like [Camarhynchus parvulus]|uniref:5'-3' exoribonuclease 2-like n=1 Tax=Geospiza parvula TaxID=87175 RepID=UPI001237DCF2|nr:5'-3' exoribonuclease 2-like [Camarhynchus parvulus]